MKTRLKILCLILSTSWVSSTIDGLSYMDPIVQRSLKPYQRGENPCNPLYWYPRHIPDYCYNNFNPRPMPIPPPLPPPSPPLPVVPQPVPPPLMPMPLPMIPANYPIPLPMPYPSPPIPIYPSAAPQFIPPHFPQYLPPTVSYGTAPMFPIANNNMVPEMQVGLQPGLSGMVSQDGGINILPFSDAYSDMLEKHKQKMIRKKLQKVLDDYDNYPHKRRYRKYRREKYY